VDTSNQLYVVFHAEDGDYYHGTGYWTFDLDQAEKFTNENITEGVYIAAYFSARVLTYPEMIDVTDQFGEVSLC